MPPFTSLTCFPIFIPYGGLDVLIPPSIPRNPLPDHTIVFSSSKSKISCRPIQLSSLKLRLITWPILYLCTSPLLIMPFFDLHRVPGSHSRLFRDLPVLFWWRSPCFTWTGMHISVHLEKLSGKIFRLWGYTHSRIMGNIKQTGLRLHFWNTDIFILICQFSPRRFWFLRWKTEESYPLFPSQNTELKVT